MNLDSITTASLSWALDAAAMRQRVIAHNISHANVDGHVRQQVNFDAHLTSARLHLQENGWIDVASLPSTAPSIAVEPALAADGSPQGVQLDVEMADLASNTVHYQTLSRGLSRYMAILAMAASEGKR